MLDDAVFIAGKFDLGVVYLEFLPGCIERYRAGAQGRGRPATATPQQCIHAGGHLFEMERLDDIVVGTGTEAIDLVLPAIAGGQNQNRVGLALLAQLANDVQTRHLG